MRLIWTDAPSAAEVAEVLALLTAAAEADGVDPVSEAGLLRLRHPGSGGAHLLARDPDGTLVGYAGLEEGPRPAAELAVHPDRRGRGSGRALLVALSERVSGPLWVWAHGEHPAALRLAEWAGLVRDRELLQMRRELRGELPERPLPPRVRLRPFVPGQDEDAVAAVNRRAFSWHPEQGRWSVEDIVVRESEPWFDPAGFLLAVGPDDRLLGFHWTKVHPDGVGEVYVVAVDPDAQGGGLGGAITAAGLAYLRGRGVTEVMLYVEADNIAAVRTYEKLGFHRHRTDVEFLRPAGHPLPAPESHSEG